MGRKSKTYSVDIECDNCEHKGKVFLPRGMKISDVLSKTDCPCCGCKTLEKERKFIVEKIQPFYPLPNPPTNPSYPNTIPCKPWESPFYYGERDTFPTYTDRVTCDDRTRLQREPNLISHSSQMLVN